jgi:hypothetical protein
MKVMLMNLKKVMRGESQSLHFLKAVMKMFHWLNQVHPTKEITRGRKNQTKRIGPKDSLMLEIPCGVVSLILVMSGIHHLNSS